MQYSNHYILHSDRVITPGRIQEGYVTITNGTIERVDLHKPPGNAPIIELGTRLLMPGIVDPHVHINDPGRTDWEGFDTATRATITGGITTVVDMPLNSSPVTTTADAFDKKIDAAKNHLHTNCALWGGIIPGNENEIEALVSKGVRGFKAFLTHSGIDEFPNVTEADLRKAMPLIAKYRLPLLVHCELANDEVQAVSHTKSYQQYLRSRPAGWEVDAIALMIRLCGEFNCPVHIVHLSSATPLKMIADAKTNGLPLTVETGQHYLYFTAEQIPDGATQFKCAPPIREASNNNALWEGLEKGIIDFVATDHSPAPPSLKAIDSGDFMKAWGGIASLQFALPVLWTAARKRGFNETHIAKWLCENPAALPGLHHRKGKIEAGFDADFVVWDPGKEFTVTDNIIQHKHHLTPYMGERLYGVVEQTYIGGQKVFDNGVQLLNKGQMIL